MAAGLDKERQDELYEAAIKAIAAIGYNDSIRAALVSEEESRNLLAMVKPAQPEKMVRNIKMLLG